MKKILDILKSIFAVIVLIGLIVGIWYTIKALWHLFTGLQKEVAAALVAATATVLVSVISVTAAKFFERRRAIEQELREKKIPVYEEFVDFLFKILMADKLPGQKMSEKDMMKFFVEFTKKLMIWGSDEVVTQWSHYRRLFVNQEPGEPASFENMFELEKLLLAIRKDTGHSNSGIKRGKVLGLFINDIDKYV